MSTENRLTNPLIDSLVDDLAPVRPLTLAQGIVLFLASTIGTVLLVEIIDGIWRGMLDGRASALFFVANGMFALLGTAASIAVLKMASPHVGNRQDGARWASVMIAVLPASAFAILTLQGNLGEVTRDMYGPECFAAGLGFATITGAALVLWLRRGAPVSLPAAGLYTGIAAGATGTFAYGLACPIDDLAHLGTWHVLPIVVSAMVGRLVVPSLVRW